MYSITAVSGYSGEEMADDAEEMRRELEEVRRLKEQLKRELEEIEEIRARYRRSYGRRPRMETHAVHIDLSGLTESLDEMLDGLGEQIRRSLSSAGVTIRAPHLLVRTKRHGSRRRRVQDIPPERVARVVSPLGSEVRLRILEFLRDGGKTFNELENMTGKTGSSLMHHLNQLIDAGYVIKGEVRGTYHVTVEGRLAYRLAQWLTSRMERELDTSAAREDTGEDAGEEDIDIAFEEEDSE